VTHARARVIPCLLLRGAGLVKTIGFRDPTYVGDPVNAIKIFNDKEVDELVLLDIDASREQRGPRYDVIRDIASECFMPLGYGGGIRTVDEIRRVLATGVEKVIVNSAAAADPALVEAAAREFGSQSVVVSLDVRKKLIGGYEVRTLGGTRGTGAHPVDAARRMEASGAGEILLTSIDRDGTQRGYDLELTRMVADAVSVPVIACGGAGSVADLAAGVREGHASAVAAGSLFVFHGRHRAVLISYLSAAELRDVRA
jgi:imidazole glycerol-phosphate synthase subunit HisF